MALINLPEKFNEIKTSAEQVEFSDVRLSEAFKNVFESYIRKNATNGYSDVEWAEFSTKIITSTKKSIFLPNYWFYLASELAGYLESLAEQHEVFKKIFVVQNLNDVATELRRGINETNEKTIKDYFSANGYDENDYLNFEKFVSDYPAWGGGKTIDRDDYFVSPLMKAGNLLAETQTAIAEIARFFFHVPELRDTFQPTFVPSRTVDLSPDDLLHEQSRGLFVQKLIGFLLEHDLQSPLFNNLVEKNEQYGSYNLEYESYRLTSLFKVSDEVLNESDLISGEKFRFFTEPFEYKAKYYYLSNQWTDGMDSRLDIQTLIPVFNSLYDSYQIVIQGEEYILKKIDSINNTYLQEPFKIEKFIANLKEANVKLNTNLPYRFISSLQTKPFSILTGLSGSGKTKLAEAFSLWISASDAQYCMVAVGADWTNREPLLGFPNALEEGSYVKPESGALDLILKAIEDLNKPYFLVLDEMNISHVERYFADFLSAMESTDRSISLRPDSCEWEDCDVPATIRLPENLFIIGTVNIDETTYMFSPKVLDRANAIEFRVSDNEMQSYFNNPNPLNIDSLRRQGASMGESFVAKSKESIAVSDGLGEILMPFFTKLQEVGAEFGYRTASEISRFDAICKEIAAGVMSDDEVIDAAIIQKLLPKLHGSRNKIEKVLFALGKLCLEDPEDPVFEMNEDETDKYPVKFPLSYEKLKRMHKSVVSDGFTSFAEA